MNKENVVKSRQKRKRDLVYIHGGKCMICGYSKCIAALQFHHINPQEKLYHLSSGNCHSWEQDINESKKCILVCGNCHAEIHAGLITQNFISTFNEERCKEREKENQRNKCLCKNCGVKITSGSNYCTNCWTLLSRKANRPDRDELKEKIRTMTFVDIGREFGVSDNSIRKWCISYNLPKRKVKYRNILMKNGNRFNVPQEGSIPSQPTNAPLV